MDNFADEVKVKDRNDRETYSLLEVKSTALCILQQKDIYCFPQGFLVNVPHSSPEIGG